LDDANEAINDKKVHVRNTLKFQGGEQMQQRIVELSAYYME